MLAHYLSSALRQLKREPLHSAIYIIGMATGLTLFILTFSYVSFQRSYDSFFVNSERIAIPTTVLKPDVSFPFKEFYAVNPAMGFAARNQISELENATTVYQQNMIAKVEENLFQINVRGVEPEFFDIFDLNFVKGSPDILTTRQDAAFISKSQAERLFQDQDPIGQTLLLEGDQLVTIEGVFADLPNNTHFQNGNNGQGMDMLVPLNLTENLNNTSLSQDWDNITTNVQTYLLLKTDTDKNQLRQNLTSLVLQNSDQDSGLNIFDSIGLMMLEDLNESNFERGSPISFELIQGIGLLILGIAVMNAISLSSARMIKRSREIGMRRTMGASRKQLITQFITETTFNTVVSLILATFAVTNLLPVIDTTLSLGITLSDILTTDIIMTVAAAVLFASFLSSSYPIAVLLGMARSTSITRTLKLSSSSAWTRKILTALQFSIVSALIVGVLTVEAQNRHLNNLAHDMKEEQLVMITSLGNEFRTYQDSLKNEIASLSEVEGVSATNTIPFSGNLSLTGISFEGALQEDILARFIAIEPGYLEMLNIDLLAGRYLDEGYGTDQMPPPPENEEEVEPTPVNVVVNMSLARLIGITEPENGLGQTFNNGQRPLTIVGIVPDIQMSSPNTQIYPTFFTWDPNSVHSLLVRYKENSQPDIEDIREKVLSVSPQTIIPTIVSLTATRTQSYASLDNNRNAIVLIAFLAIILAATGLYALAAFLASSRKREVAIRKVLGANVRQLVALLSWQFSKPVMVALLFGIPAGFYFSTLYLDNYPIRIEPGFTMALMTIAFTGFIALLTIMIHVFNAARTQPAHCLRHE